MGLSRLIILSLLIPAQVFSARSKLPLLATKQDVSNLRFVSSDGKFTYYQKRRSGTLNFSTNYKVTPVLKDDSGTQYYVRSTANKKRILIIKNKLYYKFFSNKLNKEIYISTYGSPDAKKVAEGVSPRLHLNDTWLSFYDPNQRKVKFINLDNEALKFELNIGNSVSPFFIPQVIMPSDKIIIFTDINNKGKPAILSMNRNDKTINVLYKSETFEEKIELCLSDKYVFIGQFGINSSNIGSAITKLDRDLIQIDKGNVIYTSERNDIGNIICNADDKNVYMVQNSTDDSPRLYSEAISISLEGKNEVKILSDLQFVSNIVNVDGRILIPHRGEYYLVTGKNNLTDDSIPVDDVRGLTDEERKQKELEAKAKKAKAPKKEPAKKGKSKKKKKKNKKRRPRNAA